MDLSAETTCSDCGQVQPKNRLVCRNCGGKLEASTEKARSFLLPPKPKRLRRRRLIVGLVLGGVGLAATGSVVGTVLLGERGLLGTNSSAPASLPVDRHCVLNLPFDEAALTTLVWLSDNTHLFGSDRETLFLLDVKRGKKDWVQPSAFAHQGQPARQILWTPNGRYVAEVGYAESVGYETYLAVVWDIQSKQRIWTSPSRADAAGSRASFALASNGAFGALCQDTGEHIVQIWDIQKDRLIWDWQVQDRSWVSIPTVTTLAWSPDNTRLAVLGTNGGVGVQIWDVTSGSHLWTSDEVADGQGTSVQWSPDGTTLALWDGESNTPDTTPITVLDAHTGSLLFQTSGAYFSFNWIYQHSEGSGRAQPSGPMVWSNDGKHLALLAYENSTYRIQVCDARTGRLVFTCQPVEGEVTGCSWSPDGRYLAAGTQADGDHSSIQFWDAQSGKALFSYQAPIAPGQLIWSPDSHWLAASNPQDYGQMGLHWGFSSFHLQVFEVPT